MDCSSWDEYHFTTENLMLVVNVAVQKSATWHRRLRYLSRSTCPKSTRRGVRRLGARDVDVDVIFHPFPRTGIQFAFASTRRKAFIGKVWRDVYYGSFIGHQRVRCVSQTSTRGLHAPILAVVAYFCHRLSWTAAAHVSK